MLTHRNLQDASTVELNAPHLPHENSIRAFAQVEDDIKKELTKLRAHWDNHEPRMFEQAKELSDEELTNWDLAEDLEIVRSSSSPYGSIIFGKLRVPALVDSYLHVRIHDSPGDGQGNVRLHSILTEEVRNEEGKVVEWRAFQTRDTSLEFFSEWVL
ncbi:hypothetical protein JCM10213_008352 [Rhodosporidiobolus nylandii]